MAMAAPKSSSGFDDEDDLAPLSEINVTPLVDVMLVLLIVFMVAAPLMMVGVPVNLPRTSAARVARVQEPVVVSMDRDGAVFLREAKLDGGLPAVTEALRPLVKDGPDQVVYVRADKTIAYGKVMELMGAVSTSGFAKVSLLAESAAAKPAP